MNEIYYIVQYNDRYGNGSDKSIECILKSKDDFDAWLKNHNEMRDGAEETSDEFDLIPIKLFTNQ